MDDGEIVAFVTETDFPDSRRPPLVKRRMFLGAAGAATLGGCSGRTLPNPGLGDESNDRAGARTMRGCPDRVGAERAVCPADEDGPLAVERSAGTVAGGAWRLRVRATNATDERYALDPHAWSVLRFEGEEWVPITPATGFEPRVELPPGEAYTWLLAASARAAGDGRTSPEGVPSPSGPSTSIVDADQRVFLALDPGQHAFVVPFNGPDRLSAVAPFAVER